MSDHKHAKRLTGRRMKKKILASGKKGPGANPVYPVIPVDHAVSCTTEWRNFNKRIQEEYKLPISYLDEYIRAFFIPASDLQAINEMIQQDDKISGCRVYVGIDTLAAQQQNMVGAMFKLFIVAVQDKTPPGPPGSGLDIVYSPDTGKSLVYDFTCPCPSTCDIDSVLYKDATGGH